MAHGIIVALLPLLVAAPLRAEDWMDLFDGKTLKGWVVDGPTKFKDKADGNKEKAIWTVEDGRIRASGTSLGFLRYDKSFDDFVLKVEYRLTKDKDANSGIGIRTCEYTTKKPLDSRPSFYSYEVQLLDDAEQKPHDHCTGSLYRYVAPTKMAHHAAPEWNIIEIECQGPKIRINMNGSDVLKFDQSTHEKLKSKPLMGYVCLQSHSKPVEFRSVRLKPLKK